MTARPPADRTAALDRVAIVMLSAIGDAVHVLPVISALRRHAPDCRITWFLAPGPSRLIRGHPAVDEIIEFNPRAGLAAWRTMRATLAGRQFDVALAFQVAIKAGVLTSLVPADRKLGFDRRRARDLNWLFTTERIPPHANQHVQDQYFEFLVHLGIPVTDVVWNLGPWPHEAGLMREFLAGVTRPIACVAVGSSRPDKDWPAERWAHVIDALHERYGLQPVLIGGRSPAETRAEEIIMGIARHRPLSTLGCSLREMVTVMHASQLVLSGDSAPVHIAVALGVPVIGLYGVTDPRRVGPYRASLDLVVDAYHDPGDDGRVRMEKRPGRMPRIAVDDVLAKVDHWQRGRRA